MELYQEVVSCTDCGTRITLAGLRDTREDRVTPHAFDCPICQSRVAFAVRGAREPGQPICYERRPGSPPGRR